MSLIELGRSGHTVLKDGMPSARKSAVIKDKTPKGFQKAIEN